MRLHRWAGGLLAVAGLGCSQSETAERFPEMSVVSVELVGGGIISTEHPEFATSFSPGGETIYFNRASPDRSRIDLLQAVLVDGSWSAPSPFPPTADEWAVDPFVSLDGQRVYFSSNRLREGSPPSTLNIWYVERAGDGWSDPIDVGWPINSDSVEVFNSISADGTMVFGSARNGTFEILTSRWTDAGWAEPSAVEIAGVEDATNAALQPAGSFLVLSGTTSRGDQDLYVSCRDAGGWGAARRLPAPINTEWAEFAPGVTPDCVYFTSERPGIVGPVPDSIRPPGDIYRVSSSAVGGICLSG